MAHHHGVSIQRCWLVLPDTGLCRVVGLQFGLQTSIIGPISKRFSEDPQSECGWDSIYAPHPF